jgi:hypothetical protein
MADNAKWIRWEPDSGTIQSSFGRLILYPEGFVQGFMEEVAQSGGVSVLRMLINDIGKGSGIEIPESGDFLWDDFERTLDGVLAPFDSVENKPGAYDWDGRTRSMSYRGVFTVKLWPVEVVGSLKASAQKTLTARGAGAIFGQASRKAGRAMGEMLEKTFKRDFSDALFEAVGNIVPDISRDLGWGRLTVSADISRNLIGFTIRNSFEVEAGGKDAQLIIIKNQLEGIGEYLAAQRGFTSRGREFTPDHEADARLVVLSSLAADQEINWDTVEWKSLVS